ncbi:TatD family hydrolase [Alteromonas sp. AMM-1]|uniref:TatD family hydrolase n=1 Tax=Alteromonas sp. AMM-1 TaxID=3394233 RepID=UPI0039A541CC
MIDSHCHLDLAAFSEDWQQVVQQSIGKGVSRFLVPGTTSAGWAQQVTMAQAEPRLDLAFGLHPYFLRDVPDANLQQLDELLSHRPAALVAVGEIGIDASLNTPVDHQIYTFESQLNLASKYALPVVLHHRKSHHLLIESLKRCRFQHGGVVHAFSGSVEAANAYIALGFKIGVGGTITYPRAQKTRQTIAQLPLSALLLETDAPDMPMQGRQGQRNSPVYLTDVCHALADLKRTSPDHIDSVTTANYCELFGR